MDRTPDFPHRAVIQQLASLRRAGVTHLPAARTGIDEIDAPPATQTLTEEPNVAQSAESASTSPDDKADLLKVLEDEVAGCTLCQELALARTQTVFGVGNPHARVVFFGEAPGADEDRQGEPFVGRAGQLLDKIIAACTWKREDVYILNTLKCRPPGNRNPDAAELANCRPFWQRQLEIIEPEYIVCLGKFAMQELLETSPTQAIGRMRKQFHTYKDAKVVVTYHPSYLLRNPAAKKDVWEDMKMLMGEMGVDVPG